MLVFSGCKRQRNQPPKAQRLKGRDRKLKAQCFPLALSLQFTGHSAAFGASQVFLLVMPTVPKPAVQGTER